MILRDGTVVDIHGPVTDKKIEIPVKVQKNNDGTVLVSLREERFTVDISTEFKHAMEDIVENGESHVVLDMSRVNYMDSSGLGALVALRKSIHPQGSLKLFGINEPVMSLVMLTQLSKVFDIYDDWDQARAA